MQEDVVVTLDQAVYAKAQDILWRHEPSLRNVVVRLGSFHTSMTFMAVIGKRFSDAGLRDVLTESEIVSSGSVGGVIQGKHYNRAIRVHKTSAEALLCMQWKLFEAWLDDKMPTDVSLAELTQCLSIFALSHHCSLRKFLLKMVPSRHYIRAISSFPNVTRHQWQHSGSPTLIWSCYCYDS